MPNPAHHPANDSPDGAAKRRGAPERACVDAGAMLLSALRASVLLAEASLDSVEAPSARREGVRGARRELKAVRAIAPLCRCASGERDVADRSDAGRDGRADAGDRPHNDAIDGILEFSAKANQVLGTLRDRDALTRSIHRLAERFADDGTRRVVRTVLLATLILGESDKRDEAAFAAASIERARRAIRSARSALSAMGGARASTSASAFAASPCTASPSAIAFDAEQASALLVRSFRECRGELEVALRDGDLARLHACRKKASFLALALRPFEDEVPAPVRRLRARAKRLAAALGEDRDLALLDVEMRVARAQLAGSPLAGAIDGALRLARLESGARVEDAADDFLRLGGGRVKRAIRGLFGME